MYQQDRKAFYRRFGYNTRGCPRLLIEQHIGLMVDCFIPERKVSKIAFKDCLIVFAGLLDTATMLVIEQDEFHKAVDNYFANFSFEDKMMAISSITSTLHPTGEYRDSPYYTSFWLRGN